jgi:hypothetical protein
LRALEHPGWFDGYMFARSLTIGGGTGEVQRNIVAERVLGLPHDIDSLAGMTWSETQRTQSETQRTQSETQRTQSVKGSKP